MLSREPYSLQKSFVSLYLGRKHIDSNIILTKVSVPFPKAWPLRSFLEPCAPAFYIPCSAGKYWRLKILCRLKSYGSVFTFVLRSRRKQSLIMKQGKKWLLTIWFADSMMSSPRLAINEKVRPSLSPVSQASINQTKNTTLCLGWGHPRWQRLRRKHPYSARPNAWSA